MRLELVQKLPYTPLALFAVAFGVEEAIIVMYLRHLTTYQAQAYSLEMWREFCTLVVIGAVAWIAGKNVEQRARAFCFAFGIWDIVYYLGLWGMSGVPRLTDPDVLFLIPVPWVAPVWAAMAFAAVLVLIGLAGITRDRSAVLVLGFCLGLFSFVYEAVFRVQVYPVWLFLLAYVLVLAAWAPRLRSGSFDTSR